MCSVRSREHTSHKKERKQAQSRAQCATRRNNNNKRWYNCANGSTEHTYVLFSVTPRAKNRQSQQLVALVFFSSILDRMGWRSTRNIHKFELENHSSQCMCRLCAPARMCVCTRRATYRITHTIFVFLRLEIYHSFLLQFFSRESFRSNHNNNNNRNDRLGLYFDLTRSAFTFFGSAARVRVYIRIGECRLEFRRWQAKEK